MAQTNYSDASVACMTAEPGERLGSSQAVGWTSLLMHTTRGVGVCDPFETLATPDQKIVVTQKGHLELECFSRGRWRRTTKSRNSCGMTPSLESDRLRWRALDGRPFEETHIFVPQEIFLEAAEEYRRIGQPLPSGAPRTIGVEDAVIAQIAHALTVAMNSGEPNIYAESAVMFLARHILSQQSGWSKMVVGRRRTRGISDRRLTNVIEYIKEGYMDNLPLSLLAHEAGVSKHHFVQLFRERIGTTPHQFVVEIRMQKALELLGEASLSVADVATACGYNSAVHFAAAFRRRFGRSPVAFRRDLMTNDVRTRDQNRQP